MALVALVALLAVPARTASQETPAERVARVLAEVPLFDGHNDLPGKIRDAKTPAGDVGTYDLRAAAPGDTDLARLARGRVGAQIWSVHVDVAHPRPAMQQLEQIDVARRMIAAYPDALGFAWSASDVERVFGSGRVASLLGIEGGHVVESSLGALRAYRRAGVRTMGLTHFANTAWADSGTDQPVWNGLSPFGEEVVREMNRLGMLVDLAHTSPATMSDALDVTEAPVIFSHAAARALADHPRNVPDSILARLPENGGVLMQLFYPPYLVEGEDPVATIADVADHIEHVRDVAGVDHVGIGSDFDGIPRYVEGLEDVATYPALFEELVRRGWSDDELRKLAGENLLRVMREAESVARRIQRVRPPSTRAIAELDGPRWRPLFNGRDLTGWIPKIRGHAAGEDPYGTFRVEDGLLTVGYEGYARFDDRFGHLFHEVPLGAHYQLRVEYRFVGDQAPGGPGWAVRNSGVMIHAQAPATMGLDQDFPVSLEVQLLGGDGSATRPTANLCTPGTHVEIGGVLTERHCTPAAAPTFHGPQWVTVDVFVRGDQIVHVVAGDTVLAYSRPVVGGGVVSGVPQEAKVDGTPLTGGYLALQSESHPVQFRRVLVRELEAGRR